MALNHIAAVAVLAVIVVASHSGGAGFMLSAQRKLPVWKPVLNTAFVLALCALLLPWLW
jgi:hypothetical protein